VIGQRCLTFGLAASTLYSMVQVLSLFLSLALALSQSSAAQDRTLVAEGDSVAHTKSGTKPLTHWQMWRLRNGDYEVVDTSVKNASSVQIFHFDANFLPTGYTKKSGPVSPRMLTFPDLPGWRISCEYRGAELTCNAESSDGQKSVATTQAKPPYVAIGEFYDLDFLWYMTGVVRLAVGDASASGTVNVYALTDASKAGGLSLKPDVPVKIAFLGEEKGDVMGKIQSLRKYESGSHILRVTGQGVVVSFGPKSNLPFGFEFANYKEYEAWPINK
jgi:hypothetical protein